MSRRGAARNTDPGSDDDDSLGAPRGSEAERLRAFWQQMQTEVEGVPTRDLAEFKNHQLPLARIKKVRACGWGSGPYARCFRPAWDDCRLPLILVVLAGPQIPTRINPQHPTHINPSHPHRPPPRS